MKRKYLVILILFNIKMSYGNNIHTFNAKKVGFFASFLSALNHIAWCEKNNKKPMALWNNGTLYYEKDGYNNTKNAWEYYFEPLNNSKNKPGERIHQTFEAPDGSHIPYHDRIYLNSIINKYIKIKPKILSKVEDFYKKNILGKKTISIHLRGTDKQLEVPPVPIEIILTEANKNLGYQFFVATDQQSLLNLAKKTLNGPVIYYPCYRSENSQAVHSSHNKYNKALLGEEVLIDALLLSKCDKFIHTISCVAISVLGFNPYLENVFINNFNYKN